ncbi:MAG: site-specific integrase [Bacteroidales bacterium]|nr:site-specific integrase [Bacteroidales bacterium]
MGRQKKPFPTGHFRLRYPKNYDKTKLYPIEIEYIFGGRPIRRSMNISVLVADWNPNGNGGRGEIRASMPDSVRFNNLLLAKLNKVDAGLNEYNQKFTGQVNEEIIVSFLDDKPITRKDRGEDFVTFVNKRLDSEYSRNKIGYSRYKNGQSAMNIFQMFLRATGNGTYKPDSLYVGEVSAELIDKYIKWRRDFKNNSNATINHSLTPILKGCEAACALGLIDREINAGIQDMRIQEKASLEAEGEKEFDGHNLTKEQLAKLVEFYNSDTEPRRKEFIEMFLFAFHACGLRIVDVMTLQWNHIDFEKRELSKVLIKTSKRHKIPLTEPALRILRKWQAMGRRKKYVFDLVKDELSLNDADSLYRARNTATKCVNQSLRVVGERLNFPFPLSFHTARHTFAVLAINDGLTMTVVSRLLGHSSTDITEKVYARLLPQTLTAQVEKLNYTFMPEELQ